MGRKRRSPIGPLRQSRFDEMMAALQAGGSSRCAMCGLLRPVSELDEADTCLRCEQRLVALERSALAAARRGADVPMPPRPQAKEPPDSVVYVDASYRDGLAGLAVVGALGEHTQKTKASSSVHAEVLALRWAMDMARAAGMKDLTFRTDCQAAFNALCRSSKKMRWTVEQIPRRRNVRADALAGHARRT